MLTTLTSWEDTENIFKEVPGGGMRSNGYKSEHQNSVRNRDFFNMRLVKYWNGCTEGGYGISVLRGVQDLTGQGPDFLYLL